MGGTEIHVMLPERASPSMRGMKKWRKRETLGTTHTNFSQKCAKTNSVVIPFGMKSNNLGSPATPGAPWSPFPT